MTRRALIALAVATACLLAAAAPTLAAKPPLRWSSPRLIDHAPPFGEPSGLSSVSCPSASLCLSVGGNGTVVATGPSGNQVTTGVDGGAALSDIACPSTGLCVVVEPSGLLITANPTAAKPTWKPTTLSLGDQELTGVTCASASLCVAWTDSGTVRVSTHPAGGASAWVAVTLAADSTGQDVASVGCAVGSTLCVASLGGAGAKLPEFATSTNPSGGDSAWTITGAPDTEPVDRIACPSTSLCVGIDYHDLETSADPIAGAASWSKGTVLPATNLDAFQALACPSASQCVAAVGDGSVAMSSSPAAGSVSYTVTPVLDANGFGTANVNGMDCPTTTSCLIPDRDDGLATVTLGAPPSATVASNLAGVTAIDGLSCPTSALCLGVDDAGAILRTSKPTGSASGWRRVPQPAATQGLAAISCPIKSFCAAVGADDELVTTHRPSSTSVWRATHLPFTYEGDDGTENYDLIAISCSSERLCVAGDSEFGLIVSTNPGGGPHAWKLLRLGDFNADFFDAVSCPTRSFCVAGDAQFGRVAVSTRPASSGRDWKLATIAPGVGSLAPGISSVSCPTTKFCLAGDSSGAVHTTTRPTGGSRAWKRVRIASSRLIGAWCRSSKFCVVINNRRQALASTDPSGPKSAWHSVTLDTHAFPIAKGSEEGLSALACAPTSVCLAGNGAGSLFIGR